MHKFFNLNLDLLGMITSGICAIHCFSMPFMFSFGLIGSSGLTHNHTFDIVLVCAGILIAGISLYGDFKKHAQILPIRLGMVGIGFLLFGLLGHHPLLSIFSVLGGVTLAFAHLVNWRIERSVSIR